MEFHVIDLEVDGSLHNPVVVATVLVWSTMLAGAVVLLMRWSARPHPAPEATPRVRRVLALAGIAVLYLATPLAQHLIGNLIYQLLYLRGDRRLGSVGFWGGPPVMPSWVLAGLTGFLCTKRGAKSGGSAGEV